MQQHTVLHMATATDVANLQQISRTTFLEAFAQSNTEENMRHYLDTRLSPETLATELAHPQSEFYLACRDEKVIGYLKVNSGNAQTEAGDADAVEIERIYVLSEYYGLGIGQVLLEKAFAVATEQDASYLWLGVWEHNHRALAFYRKHGFIAFDRHVFVLGTDHQTDIMMKLEPPFIPLQAYSR